MAYDTKKRTVNQRRGDFGEDLAAKKLPPEWVVRKINPDFGLDLHVEVFEPVGDAKGDWQTTGEHFFAQVKTKKEFSYGTKEVIERLNVAKFPIAEPREGAEKRTIEVVKCTLDTATINTVEAMGPAVPVFLLCADEKSQDVFYVCLNDYIEKILIPEKPNYRTQDSSTIYIPIRNRWDFQREDFAEVLLMARRPKLYAAFAMFNYQEHELASAIVSAGNQDISKSFATSSLMFMLKTFTRRALALDIWRPLSSTSHWSQLTEIREMFANVQSGLEALAVDESPGAQAYQQRVHEVMTQAVRTVGEASRLGRLYEETFREQRLPSYFAELFAESI